VLQDCFARSNGTPTKRWDFNVNKERYIMAIQELSKEEINVVAGGLVLLGLDLGAILNALLTPIINIVVAVLNTVANVVAAVGTLVGNLLTSVNNVLVGLGL